MDKFGLESVLKVHEAEIKGKATKVAVVLHWCLLKKGLYFNGLGDNFSDDYGDVTEVLPAKWSENMTWKYREVSNRPNKFLFRILVDSQVLNVTLLRMSDEVTKNFTVDLSKEIDDNLNLVQPDEFLSSAIDTLLSEFFPKPKKPEASSASARVTGPEPRPGPPGPPNVGAIAPGARADPLRIGRGDLDPFGGFEGGGMMMDPQGLMGRGRGRGMMPNFDPVFPGMPNPGVLGGGRGGMGGPRFGGPGFGPGGRNFGDEMPPPGPAPPGYDDMFM